MDSNFLIYLATCDDCGTEYQEFYGLEFATSDNIYVKE